MSLCADCGELHTVEHACEPLVTWAHPELPDPACPDCGGSFTIDEDAEMGVTVHPGYHVPGTALEERMVRVVVAFCNGCEFCLVLKRITL